MPLSSPSTAPRGTRVSRVAAVLLLLAALCLGEVTPVAAAPARDTGALTTSAAGSGTYKAFFQTRNRHDGYMVLSLRVVPADRSQPTTCRNFAQSPVEGPDPSTDYFWADVDLPRTTTYQVESYAGFNCIGGDYYAGSRGGIRFASWGKWTLYATRPPKLVRGPR